MKGFLATTTLSSPLDAIAKGEEKINWESSHDEDVGR